jgi:hypothetical protein
MKEYSATTEEAKKEVLEMFENKEIEKLRELDEEVFKNNINEYVYLSEHAEDYRGGEYCLLFTCPEEGRLVASEVTNLVKDDEHPLDRLGGGVTIKFCERCDERHDYIVDDAAAFVLVGNNLEQHLRKKGLLE